jgi:hypothetical protein
MVNAISRIELLRAFIILLAVLSLTTAGCSVGDNDTADDDDPGEIVTQGERETNDTFDSAQPVNLPEDTDIILQIRANARSDGTFFGGPNADIFDIFRFTLSTSGTYEFKLSELSVFNLDLSVLTRESLINEIPGVNFFESSIDAPSEGAVESLTADLNAGVEYFIRVRTWNTNDEVHTYTVFIEKL